MSSLVVSYADLLEEIGRKVGWGANSVWSADATKSADAEKFIRSGLRRFYFPMVEGQGRHVWSFLTPKASLTLTNAVDTYELPADFVDIKTGFANIGTQAVRLSKKSEVDIRELARQSPKSGMPEFYAIRTKDVVDGSEPRYEVQFYPTPDAAYVLDYRYVLSPPTLSTASPYHLGGPQHSETVLAAVLASAEEFLDDEQQVHSGQFQRLLISSIALDRELSDDEGDGEDLWEPTSSLRTLSIDLAYLRRVVGRELQFGPNAKLWTRKQVEEVQLAIETGYRRFCYPPQVVEDRPKHVWSFLTPTTQLVAATGSTDVPLPDGFTELTSEAVTFVGSTANRSAVRVGQDSVRRLRAASPKTGAPSYVAVRVRKDAVGDSTVGTQYDMMLYPTPDQDYTLEYRYLLTPPALSDEHPIPLGGAQHAETIIASCLAAAEQVKGLRDGPREVEFRTMLANSIIRDAELANPNEGDIWPVEDDEQTLSINKGYLKRLIGKEAGFGPHSSLWTHAQSKQVQAIMETGLRKFYDPVVLPGERYSHEWSFLRPYGSVTTIAEVYEYDLPIDFALMTGPLTFAPGESALYPALEIYGEEQLRTRRQWSSASYSRPTMAAIVPKNVGEDGRTHYSLHFWPTPEAGYTIYFRYRTSPDSLSDEAALPIGGPPHAQTVMEACLAAAEEMAGVGNGTHGVKFIERLRASVSHDRQVNAPDTLGYNHDRSDNRYGLDNWHSYDDNLVTYKDQTY